jgi:hypothetical protein
MIEVRGGIGNPLVLKMDNIEKFAVPQHVPVSVQNLYVFDKNGKLRFCAKYLISCKFHFGEIEKKIFIKDTGISEEFLKFSRPDHRIIEKDIEYQDELSKALYEDGGTEFNINDKIETERCQILLVQELRNNKTGEVSGYLKYFFKDCSFKHHFMDSLSNGASVVYLEVTVHKDDNNSLGKIIYSKKN